MKKVTRNFLKENKACIDRFDWWCKNCEELTTEEQIKKLAEYRFDWANWLIVRIMTKKQRANYAIFSAEQVIDIFEKKYPEDKRPRNMIEEAKDYLNNPCEKTKAAAAAAAYVAARSAAAADAADAADAAYVAARSAADDAYAAARSDAYAAYDAARSAAARSAAARLEIEKKIIDNGIDLLINKT